MSQKYLIRIAELERLLSEQAEALRQKDQQLSLVEETEAFLRSALTPYFPALSLNHGVSSRAHHPIVVTGRLPPCFALSLWRKREKDGPVCLHFMPASVSWVRHRLMKISLITIDPSTGLYNVAAGD